MKRWSLLGSASFLLLTACAQPPLSSEEAFGRAEDAIRAFRSASFTMRGGSTLDGKEDSKMDASGMIADGRRWNLDMKVGVDIEPYIGMGLGYVSVDASIAVPAPDETYIKLDSITIGGGLGGLLDGMEGKWWKVPPSSSASGAALLDEVDSDVMADQFRNLTITKEYGLQPLHDRQAYKYDVVVDAEKALASLRSMQNDDADADHIAQAEDYLRDYFIRGTVWIDATSFFPVRMEWKSTSINRAEKREATFDMTFADYNEGLRIPTPPDAIEFDADSLQLPGLGSEGSLPPAAADAFDVSESDLQGLLDAAGSDMSAWSVAP